MGWFSHKHFWWRATRNHPIKNETGGNAAFVFIEECDCGAVRTIEVRPGHAPVVMMGEPANG
jgi:hypothetical protein